MEICQRVEAAGACFVDGGIIGPPARHAGSTRLYLSGDGAHDAARLFQGSVLVAVVCGDRPGATSALKMCYAAWTKGSAAMLMAVRAAAAAELYDRLASFKDAEDPVALDAVIAVLNKKD